MAKGTKTGGGSRKGVPNKATHNAREAIARLVNDNAARMQEWLDKIASSDGPKAAWDCMVDVIEYHIPKLARTELTGQNGGPLQIQNMPEADVERRIAELLAAK